jgi:hypothetical protein
MRYDPNDRTQRHILIWELGTDLLEAEERHRMRTGYGGGLCIIGRPPGTSDQEAFARHYPKKKTYSRRLERK